MGIQYAWVRVQSHQSEPAFQAAANASATLNAAAPHRNSEVGIERLFARSCMRS